MPTEASAPLTFMKVRRFMEGLSYFFSLSLSIFILPPFNDCIFYLHYLICECVSDCLNFFLRKDDKGAHPPLIFIYGFLGLLFLFVFLFSVWSVPVAKWPHTF